MNFNGSDRAVTIGWLRKHGSLCSWPRLYCCQDSSRQLQFTILPWLHKTGLLQKPTLQKKKKKSWSSSAIGENYSSLGNWGRISRCHLTARSHHQEASYSLRSQGSWKGAAQSFQLRFNCSAEGGTQDIKREIFSIHVKGQKQLHPLMTFGFLMRHHLLSQLICFHLIIPYLFFFFNITVNYCAIIKVYFKM